MNTDLVRNTLRLTPPPVGLMIIACVVLVLGNTALLFVNAREVARAMHAQEALVGQYSLLRRIPLLLLQAESAREFSRPSPASDAVASASSATAALTALVPKLRSEHPAGHQLGLAYERLRALLNGRIHGLSEAPPSASPLAPNPPQPTNGIATPQAWAELDDALSAVEAALTSEFSMAEETLAKVRITTVASIAVEIVTLVALTVLFVNLMRNVRRRLDAETQLRSATDTLETKVAVRTAQLSHLSRHLLQLGESEKAALANELHDELGSNLTAMNLDITSVATRLARDNPELAERLNRSLRLLHETVDIKRRIIHGLRPSMLDSLGICAAIRMHCEDFTRRTHLPCDADCPEDFPDVDSSWSIAIYRVAQEALNNIAKYASAKQVRVVLRSEPNGVALQIIDDGVGIDLAATDKPLSHGLLGMRERIAQLGGRLEIRRGESDGRGTVVDAFVPYSTDTSPQNV